MRSAGGSVRDSEGGGCQAREGWTHRRRRGTLPRQGEPMTERARYRSVVADSLRWDGFRFRDGDIVISTPPKCGTTWMQRLVALLVFDGPDLPAPISKVSPWLDMQLAPLDEGTALLEAQQHRRFIKTHTPLDGIPHDPRVRYVAVGRDPRDVAVSVRHHMANLNVERFMASRQGGGGARAPPQPRG